MYKNYNIDKKEKKIQMLTHFENWNNNIANKLQDKY